MLELSQYQRAWDSLPCCSASDLCWQRDHFCNILLKANSQIFCFGQIAIGENKTNQSSPLPNDPKIPTIAVDVAERRHPRHYRSQLLIRPKAHMPSTVPYSHHTLMVWKGSHRRVLQGRPRPRTSLTPIQQILIGWAMNERAGGPRRIEIHCQPRWPNRQLHWQDPWACSPKRRGH